MLSEYRECVNFLCMCACFFYIVDLYVNNRVYVMKFVGYLRQLPGLETVAMTTNGITLTRQLVALQRAGLNALNISLDTLKPERFEVVSRRRGWQKVMAGIDLAIQLGYRPLKVSTNIVNFIY